MASAKTVTIGIAMSSYQREAPTTMLRLAEKLLAKGVHVNIWTFEDGTALSNKDQKDHMEPPGLREVSGQQHTYVGKFVDGIMISRSVAWANFQKSAKVPMIAPFIWCSSVPRSCTQRMQTTHLSEPLCSPARMIPSTNLPT